MYQRFLTISVHIYIGPNHLFYQTSSRTFLLDVQQNFFLLDVQQQKNSLYWTSSRQCGLVHELPRPRKQQKNRSTGRPVERFYWTSSRILLDVQQSRRFGGIGFFKVPLVKKCQKVKKYWHFSMAAHNKMFWQQVNNFECPT